MTSVISRETIGGVLLALALIHSANAAVDHPPQLGTASWYGEEHRGRLMADGKRFDPDKLTAASWFYPLGAQVRVTRTGSLTRPHSVLVTITDRGPAHDLVNRGRIIDLSLAAFKKLSPPERGLVRVVVQPVLRR